MAAKSSPSKDGSITSTTPYSPKPLTKHSSNIKPMCPICDDMIEDMTSRLIHGLLFLNGRILFGVMDLAKLSCIGGVLV